MTPAVARSRCSTWNNSASRCAEMFHVEHSGHSARSNTATTSPGDIGSARETVQRRPEGGLAESRSASSDEMNESIRPPGTRRSGPGPASNSSILTPRYVSQRTGSHCVRSARRHTRRVTTCAAFRPVSRKTVSRNADFFSEASTMTRRVPGWRIARGIAGNPFPDPRSSSVPSPTRRSAAAIGSMKCRLTIASRARKPVRFVRLPHWRNSR
jgi:hypothetical protein